MTRKQSAMTGWQARRLGRREFIRGAVAAGAAGLAAGAEMFVPRPVLAQSHRFGLGPASGIWCTDDGVTFSRCSPVHDSGIAMPWADEFVPQNIIYMIQDGSQRLEYTLNGGASWAQTPTVSPVTPGGIGITTSGNLITVGGFSLLGGLKPAWSSDGGSTWTTGAVIQPPDQVNQYYFISDSLWRCSDGSMVILLTGPSRNSIYRSTDEGQTWAEVFGLALQSAESGSLAYKSTVGGNILLCCISGQALPPGSIKSLWLYLSVDCGATWTLKLSTPPSGPDNYNDPYEHPLWGGARNYPGHCSNDSWLLFTYYVRDVYGDTSGDAWRWDGNPGDSWTHDTNAFPTSLGTETGGSGILWSDNGGLTYCFVKGTMWKSTDGGHTWTAFPPGPGNERPAAMFVPS